MKKLLTLSFLLLIIALMLTGCAAPDPDGTDPVQEPTVTQAPTYVAPTPEPTVTPRVMEGVIEEPDAGATLLAIDPIDKPTRPPIIYEPYIEVTETGVGVSFKIPSYWVRSENANAPTAIVYQEPPNDIRSGTGVPSLIAIYMQLGTSTQTIADAEAFIDQIINSLPQEGYTNIEVSSKADNRFLGQTGRYVTYRLDSVPDESGATLRMRGRILVVPVDRKLYMVRYLCPADYNTGPDGESPGGYEEVYKMIRETLKEL